MNLNKDPYSRWRRGLFWTSFALGATLSAVVLIAVVSGVIYTAARII